MRRHDLTAIAVAAAVLTLPATYARAQEFIAHLNGFEEIGGLGAGETGAILSNATATLRLDLDRKSSTISYTLAYTTGFSSGITQAHIHFGKEHVAGGIIVFLCTNAGNGPAGTPTCSPAPATVKGMLTAASVVGPTAQNVPAGVFDGIEDALASDTAYANIHTANFPAGEIRGQVRSKEEEERHERQR
jgi:hypothetical protein